MNRETWTEHLSQWMAFLTEQFSSTDDIGERIKTERQLRTLEQVRHAAVLNPKLLIEFINPSDNICDDSTHIEFLLNLNESQRAAVRAALGAGVLSLIQGPPGTGKTQVISEICLQLYRQNPDIRVLVCSETHVAVNNLISRISEHDDTIRIVRIRDREQDSSVDEFSPEAIINTYKEWLRLNCNSDDIANTIIQSLSNPDDRSLEKALALSANIVGMTCNRISAYVFESSIEMFDVVIIDEVCKATLPEILMPLIIAQKAVLVGDPKQLPPVFCSEEIDIIKSIEKCNLQKYMFIDELFTRSKNVTILDTQYRMTNQIGTLIGELFYSGKLKNGRNVDIEDGVVWIDYNPTQMWPIEEANNTAKPRIFNRDECEIISRILSELDRATEIETPVAVIAPYKHQVYELRNTVDTANTRGLIVNVDTVDGFQGKESDIVIFSLTRTLGSFRFLADDRRLNVALSRARNKLFIVGSLEYATKNGLLRTISESCHVLNYNDVFKP